MMKRGKGREARCWVRVGVAQVRLALPKGVGCGDEFREGSEALEGAKEDVGLEVLGGRLQEVPVPLV